jgi:predicted exporter
MKASSEFWLRWGVIITLTILLGSSAWYVSRASFNDSIDSMIPADSELHDSLKLLEAAQLSGKVIVWFQRDPQQVTDEAFFQALDDFASSLTSPLITRVHAAKDMFPTSEDLSFFLNKAPQLLRSNDYTVIERKLAPASVEESLKRIRREMMTPQSLVSSDLIRKDPLGIRAMALKPLERMAESLGYNVVMQNGHFLSKDGTSALLFLDTPVALTDHAGARQMLGDVDKSLRTLPTGIQARVICGHQHTLSNQAVIKRDVALSGTISAVFMILLFLLFFRDWRAVIVFVIPPTCVLIALALAVLLGMKPALVVIGLTGLLIGVAIDYGIHVFIAVTYRDATESLYQSVRKVHKPLFLSTGAALATFLVFLSSSAPGYRQMGFLAAITLILSLGISLWILPLMLGKRLVKKTNFFKSLPAHRPVSKARSYAILVVFAVLIVAAIPFALTVSIEADFTRLDGTARRILQDEEAFFDLWGTGMKDMGIYAVWASDRERTLEANDRAYDYMLSQAGLSNSWQSLSSFWPSQTVRENNARQWISFWNSREAPLQALLRQLGPSLGFSEQAFNPFFDSLNVGTQPEPMPENNRFFDQIAGQYLRTNEYGYMALSFFPDTEPVRKVLSKLPRDAASSSIVSRRELRDVFSTSMTREIRRLAWMGMFCILLASALILRDVRSLILLSLMIIASVAGSLAMIALTGQSFNASHMLALVLVIGLTIDHASFKIEAIRGHHSVLDYTILLAWLTTMAGAVPLLLAHHPALFSLGFTLSIGLSCGYFTGVWVLEPAARLLGLKNDETI